MAEEPPGASCEELCEAWMKRLKQLGYKLAGLKGFIWIVATVLLCYNKISSQDWVLISGATGLFNVAQKHEKLGGKCDPDTAG
jgi:hypothetical protein